MQYVSHVTIIIRTKYPKKKTTKTISIIKYHECVTIKQKRKIAGKKIYEQMFVITSGCWLLMTDHSQQQQQKSIHCVENAYNLCFACVKNQKIHIYYTIFTVLSFHYNRQQNSNLVLSLTVSNISTPNLILCIRGIHEKPNTHDFR